MSEFQLYRFKAIDRPLTKAEQEEVRSWSSRARVTSTSATFIYHYGDFRKEEEKVVEEYFDAMLYVSNWGTQRLLFRFPLDTFDRKTVNEFAIIAETGYTTHLDFQKKANCWLLDFYWSDDESGGWMEEEDYELEDFLSIRNQIMNGDYRALYLFWLRLAAYSYQFDGEGEADEFDDFEEGYGKVPPPVPPNLNSLTGDLQNFVNFFAIDEDLIAAAADYSFVKKTKKNNYTELVLQLSENERIDFVVRLAKGEPNLSLTLNRRLRDFMKMTDKNDNENKPSIFQLIQKSKGKETNRLAQEAEEARLQHINKMEKLVPKESELWAKVYTNIRLQRGNTYDLATETLKDLKDLAAYKGLSSVFKEKMFDLKKEFGRSTALMNRFYKAKLFQL
jgi:hypothetical protein